MNNVLRTLIYDGQVSLTVVDGTEIVEKGLTLHKYTDKKAELFGRALCLMTFMSACLKNEQGQISLSIKSTDGVNEIAVSGNQALQLRGYIDTEKQTLGKEGSMTVIRDDRYSRPFVGSCALPTEEDIDRAFETYYEISEQLPTYLASVTKRSEKELFAGAVVLQPLPFAEEKTLEKVKAFNGYEFLAELQTKGIETLVEEKFDIEKSVWEFREGKYNCNCSREYLKEVLVSLGEKQMRQIIKEDGAVRIHCHYCNTDYEFTDADADTMF